MTAFKLGTNVYYTHHEVIRGTEKVVCGLCDGNCKVHVDEDLIHSQRMYYRALNLPAFEVDCPACYGNGNNLRDKDPVHRYWYTGPSKITGIKQMTWLEEETLDEIVGDVEYTYNHNPRFEYSDEKYTHRTKAQAEKAIAKLKAQHAK